jgi:putative membrane protein
MFSQIDRSLIWALDWAHMGGDWDHMSDQMDGWGWGMMIWFWLFLFGVVALVVWAVWALVRHGSGRATRSGAVAVLEERFARGDLSPEEYRERREILEER